MSGTFRDLEVWKAAMELAVQVYRLTARFPKEERYGLTSQMRRAAVSVPSNIAEGKGRASDKELIQFLASHARGSLFEIETQLTIGEQLSYSTTEDCNAIRQETARIGQMINGLIRSVRPAFGSLRCLKPFRKPKAGSRLVAAHGFAVRHYILIVFFHGAGEAVVALGVGDEIVVVALGGMHRRF
jgi:four helix bundle protein